MADVQLGVMKPAYLAKAARLESDTVLHANQARKVMAQGRHPANAGRRSEFLDQAQKHISRGNANSRQIAAQPASNAGTVSRVSEFFNSQPNMN